MMDEMLARMWVCKGDAAGSWSLTFALDGFGGAKQGYVLEGFVDIGGSRHAFEEHCTYSHLACGYTISKCMFTQVQGCLPEYGWGSSVEGMLRIDEAAIDLLIGHLCHELQALKEANQGSEIFCSVRLRCVGCL
jgi:hypothetical protein